MEEDQRWIVLCNAHQLLIERVKRERVRIFKARMSMDQREKNKRGTC